MSQEEFLELAAIYQDSCSSFGGGLLEGLICSLLNLLEALNLTVITDIAASLGIDLSPVIILVQQVLGGVNGLLGGVGLKGLLSGVTGALGGAKGLGSLLSGFLGAR